MHKNSYCFVFLGIQLIERNEEVCVLYEKINVQGSVIRNGDMEMQSREEEMRFLKMEASDLRRQIDLLKGLLSVNIPILFKNLKTKITYGLFGLAKSLPPFEKSKNPIFSSSALSIEGLEKGKTLVNKLCLSNTSLRIALKKVRSTSKL